MTDKKTVFDSVTIRKKVGCGELCCIFEHDEEAFKKFRVKLNCVNEFVVCPHCKKEIEGNLKRCEDFWFDVVAKTLTFAIRRAIWEGHTVIERGIIKHLKNETAKCRYYTPNKDHVASCVDAIGKSIEQYMKIKGCNEIKSIEKKKEDK